MRPKGQIFDLKSFRAKHNLSQKEVAEATGRKQSFLSAIEAGRRSAPDALLNDLVERYGEENISDYLHDRIEPTFGSVDNVNDAIVNSPYGTILINEFGGKFSRKDIMRLLEIEKESREQVAEKEAEETSKEAAPQQGVDPATLTNLVNLLTASEARNKEAEARIKILEAKVLELQAEIDKAQASAKTSATKK